MKYKKPYAISITAILSGILLAVLVKFFLLDVLVVSGSSMEPTLKSGTHIAVQRCAYGISVPFGNKLLTQWKTPQNNDIVIFLRNDTWIVKRCCGQSGTELDYSTESGYNLLVGDESIPLTEQQYMKMKNIHRVPDGMFLAIGDNRADSVDSRQYGFIPNNNALGKVICRKTVSFQRQDS